MSDGCCCLVRCECVCVYARRRVCMRKRSVRAQCDASLLMTARQNRQGYLVGATWWLRDGRAHTHTHTGGTTITTTTKLDQQASCFRTGGGSLPHHNCQECSAVEGEWLAGGGGELNRLWTDWPLMHQDCPWAHTDGSGGESIIWKASSRYR